MFCIQTLVFGEIHMNGRYTGLDIIEGLIGQRIVIVESFISQQINSDISSGGMLVQVFRKYEP